MSFIKKLWSISINSLGWVFGLFLVVYGVTMTLTDPVIGLMFIGFGLFCTPYVYTKVKQSNISVTKVLGIATVVGFGGIILNSAMTAQDVTVLQQPQHTHQNEKEVETTPAAHLPQVAVKPVKVIDKGHWHVRYDRSKIDDSKSVYLILEAKGSFRNDFGKRITPTLHIRCQENKTDLIVNFDTFLGIDETFVLYRIGKGKAKTKTKKWNIASNHFAVFAPQPIGFVRQMMQHKSLLLQTTPHGSNIVTIEFDTYGLKEAILPLQTACSWR